MDAAVIRQALEEKYLAPTRRERPLYSGIEVEMPILNLKKEAVDFELVHRTAERFMDICGFVPEKRDDEGEVILAADPVTGDYRALAGEGAGSAAGQDSFFSLL